MKRIVKLLVIIGVMLLGKVVFAESILLNGDFSEIGEEGIKNWFLNDGKPDRSKIFLVDDGVLCIENKISNATKLRQNVKVAPDSYYRLSAKAKVLRESNSGVYLEIDLLNDAVSTRSNIVKKKDVDWEEIALYGKTDKDQYFINVNLCLGEKKNEVIGKVLIKDVKLEKLDYQPKLYDNWYTNEINSNEVGILADLCVRVVLAVFFMLVIWFIVKNISFDAEEPIREDGFSKKDVILVFVLTVAYLVMALYKLGNTFATKTGWLTKSEGEYVVMKLPIMTHIGKINIFEGQNDKNASRGKLKIEYLDEELEDGDTNDRYHIIKRVDFGNHILREIVEDTKAMTLKITVLEPGLDIKEIAIFEKGHTDPIEGVKILEDQTKDHVANKILDEQNLIPYNGSHMINAIFDEVLYARTGYEYINNKEGFEATHPPLGKILMAVGIKIFGMTPFGWRISSTIFGVLMVPLMYMFARKFFINRLYIVGCTILIMFDCMHFTQTRTCLIDSYAVFFIIMMYYYMMNVYRSVKMDKKYIISFMLSGLFFSLGIATKWIVLYGGLGLAILYFLSLYKNFWHKKPDLLKSVILGITFFVVMPIIVYLLVYIPVLRPTEVGYTLGGVIDQVKSMFVFHRYESTAHEYSSKWYEWLVMIKPMLFYGKELDGGMYERVITMGNPLIWHLSLVSIIASAIIGYKKKDNGVWVFVLGYLCQYLPWMFITRTTYIYHYFSAVPFAIFAIMYVMQNLDRYKVYDVVIYQLMVVITFFVFYPLVQGMVVKKLNYDVLREVMVYPISICEIVYCSKMLNGKIKMKKLE
ncbi:MAG: phospholipid carrier-dependent glycosyltransferase [Clostridiales bacterium]|nr:phospholipid carrier-dependent glycosyltransferase [Clostridiales bacterium]